VRSSTIGEIGRLMATAEMLRSGLAVGRPEVDVGYDALSISGDGSVWKVQVKSKLHHGNGKYPVRRKGRTLAYCRSVVDAFVLVGIDERLFFVLPADAIDLNRHSIILRAGCEWHNAWHLLESPPNAT
jgi:hypothetical protein